jgi:signal transduction histidine kinase
MAPRAREGAIDWLLRPWLEGRGFGARAGRIAISAGVLTLLILPAMMLWFGPSGWWWDVTLVVSVTTPLGIIVADAIAELVRPGRLGLPRSVALFVGFVLGMLGGYVVIALVRSPLERPPDVLFRDFRRNVLIVGPVLLVVGGLVASLWYRAEAYRLESAAASARYAVLEGQLQPHFLFNALNALKELIADDPERAREFTQKLADLYRRILQTTTSRTTSLSDELAIVRQYLEVEQLRHGERLAWTLDHPPELAQRRVPALVVQTLVENAVKHGIAKSRAGGTVAVTAERAPGDALRLTVRNTGAPFRPGEGGRGLENTRARLLLMYGSESRFEIGAEDGATVATFVVGAHAKDAVS